MKRYKQKGRGITTPNIQTLNNNKRHINTFTQTRKEQKWNRSKNKGAINTSTQTRKGLYWNRNENNRLRESIKKMTIKNIAKTHGRTRGAITSRLQKIYPTYRNHGANKLNLIRANQQAKIRAAGIQRADEILRNMRANNAEYRGLKVSVLYDSDWKIPTEDQRKLIDVSIATNKLRFQNLDKYDFTKPMDVKFIFDNEIVLLQDVDVKNVIDILNNPLIHSILFLQPNV